MERNLYSQYLTSQDQLIIGLNQQIEYLAPLKDSYSNLQRYQVKLSHDFQSLLADSNHMSSSYLSKIQQLFVTNDELDSKKNFCIDQLRNLENSKAKLILERKNLMTSCDTLSNKYNLQNEQNVRLRQQTRDIVQVIRRTEQNIDTTRKIINDIEYQIKLKLGQNNEIQNQILRKVQCNRKMTQKCQEIQKRIKTTEASNDKTIEQMKLIDKNQDDLHQRIRQSVKRNKQLTDKQLCIRQQLSHLSHQKQYYLRLIESEMLIKEDLQVSQTRLKALLQRKTKQCQKLNKQNSILNSEIHDQQERQSKSIKYKQDLMTHLNQLIRANSVLIDTMKKSCREDEKVHIILGKKLDGLNISLMRPIAIQSNQWNKKTAALKQRTNQLMTATKKAEKSSDTWINELTNIQNRC